MAANTIARMPTAASTAFTAVFAWESRTVYTRLHRLSPLRKKLDSDVVVVGAGVAGLTAALAAAEAGASVRVVAKGAGTSIARRL